MGTAGNSTPTLSDPNAADIERNQVIRELIETERKYVGDLEVMRVCTHHPNRYLNC